MMLIINKLENKMNLKYYSLKKVFFNKNGLNLTISSSDLSNNGMRDYNGRLIAYVRISDLIFECCIVWFNNWHQSSSEIIPDILMR